MWWQRMQHTTPVIIGLLVLFSIYRRTRRTIGFQKITKGRMITSMVLLSIVGVIVLVSGYLHPEGYLFDVVGIVLGGVMAFYAMRTTSFEKRQDHWVYRTNRWIGAVLFLLLIVRIFFGVYRDRALLGSTASTNGQAASHVTGYPQDIYTNIILFALFTYYIVFYGFLLRRKQHLELSGQESDSQT
jgi:hypothetical protein